MRNVKIFTLVGSIVLLVGTANAQTEKGKWELSLLGSYNCGWISAGDYNSQTLQIYDGGLGVGYFLSKPLEVKLDAAILGAGGGGVNMAVVPVTLGLNYHFNIERLSPYTEGKTVPYIGAGLGGAFATGGITDLNTGGSQTTGCIMFDAHVGLKQFVSKNVSLNFQVGYQYLPLPFINLNNITAGVGLSFYF